MESCRKENTDNLIKLFSRLKKDELAALNEIYKLYSKKILKFAYSFSISLEDAEEIVQDTFVKIWANRKNIDLQKSIDAYLFVITKNQVLNKIKKRALDDEAIKRHFNNTVEKHYSQLDEIIDYRESKAIIDKIIDSLPEKRREIFILNRFKGLSYREIASLLNISQGTVEKQMTLAIKTLKSKLSAYDKIALMFLLLAIIA